MTMISKSKKCRPYKRGKTVIILTLVTFKLHLNLICWNKMLLFVFIIAFFFQQGNTHTNKNTLSKNFKNTNVFENACQTQILN